MALVNQKPANKKGENNGSTQEKDIKITQEHEKGP